MLQERRLIVESQRKEAAKASSSGLTLGNHNDGYGTIQFKTKRGSIQNNN
jgi:hypothetical protein